ncbi:co-chaperone p23 domain-containing protein [Naegleria gruberi]|uniref:Co-chaperone p23 domain-containing protein n=1 Tax=Naegleria gruberi TaxID=5762 RepID=D2V768_NAEGR|nr:co-chaperone p23 domain-containing protein [Naegleria gruberi]EFC47321.1 co-chaperone p23 domain-containing protein [Naegleria gruberi]|eukprot:XP_002680065.1 co-chaperone p23 domain-containing protein [Naegleria gruberi strain NEG-M]
MSVHVPHVLWAPRADRVYVTVEVPDATDVKVSLDNSILKFSATGGENKYELELELFGEINTEKSKWKVSGRSIDLNIERTESGEFWPRLTKSNIKNRNIAVDWSKWIDEDDEEEDNYDWNQSGGDVNDFGMDNFYPPQGDEDDMVVGNDEDEEDEEKPDLSDLDK